MRTFCGSYRNRRFYKSSRSFCSLYSANTFHNPCRIVFRRQKRFSLCFCLYDFRLDRTSYICFRRRSRIYFPAKLRLYNRLCRGSSSHRNNSPQESKSLIWKIVIRLFCRTCYGLSFRNDLLLHNKQLLFGNRNRTLAAVSLLLPFGCSRRYCYVLLCGNAWKTSYSCF